MNVKNRAPHSLIAERTNWKSVEERLTEERRRKLPLLETSAVIERFRLSWKVAQKAGDKPRHTGLVEQQACFAVLRKIKS